jgi:hypothetical protein
MKKTGWRGLVIISVAVFVTLSAVTAGYAAGPGVKKTLEAVFGLNNISYKGQDLTAQMQPFAVDGVTYLPLRKMGELFNKDIQWDQATNTVIISDKTNPVEDQLKAQIAALQTQISSLGQLQARIAILEAQLDEYKELLDKNRKSNKDIDLDDLEDELNDDYWRFKNDDRDVIEFDISLSGDDEEIELIIEVDLDEFEDEWDDTSSSELLDYVQDICDDILDEYDDAEIDGYFEDSSSSKSSKLMYFYTDRRGNVKSGKRSGSSSRRYDLDDLEDDLNDYYSNYFESDDIYDMEITLSGDEDEIEFNINIDLDEYEYEWDDLSDKDIKGLMEDIYYTIEDEYDDADIEGYVYDTDARKNAAYIYKSSYSGNLLFSRSY